ncbi:MAG: hypothetical protein PHI09_04790 [Candidatus Omnitrophica bacterium]|nr:hypothetical protein [Candidatus Omnitrophota bacterium]
MPSRNIRAIVKKRINKVLKRYPLINEIIPRNDSFYRLTRCQYGKGTPESQRELRLSGILHEIYPVLDFINMLEIIELYLEKYPEYRTKAFGKKISDNFFSFFSEIEIYDRLKNAGLNPIIDPNIMVNGRKKQLDFLVRVNNEDYYIEVVTPRTSKVWEEEFTRGGAGFLDPEKGLGPKNKGDRYRANDIIVQEIKKHLLGLPQDVTQCNIIVVINIRYSALEIIMGENPTIFDRIPPIICGILLYNENTGRYYPNPRTTKDEEVIKVFSHLFHL